MNAHRSPKPAPTLNAIPAQIAGIAIIADRDTAISFALALQVYSIASWQPALAETCVARGELMRSRFTRRHALQTLTSLGALTVSRGASLNATAGGAMIPAQAGGVPADQNKRWKGSALGNLYPFIREEQQLTRQRLAFLHRRPKDLEAWKAEGRAQVFDALAY